MNLSNASRSLLSKVPGANRAIDFICARANELFGQQHNNETGVHTAITGDSLTVTKNVSTGATGVVTATGTSPHTFAGDVVALNGTGTECGIGTLASVNGVPLLTGELQREGALLGGIAAGFFLEVRTAQSPMDGSTVELCIWNLKFDTAHPIWRLGIISGLPTLIDGGTGSTPMHLGDATRPIGQVATNALSAPSGTMTLNAALQMLNNTPLQMKSVGGTVLDVLHVDAAGNGHVIGGHSADFPLGMVRAAAAVINAGSANMDGGLLWDTTNSWLVGYVNGTRYKFIGTPY